MQSTSERYDDPNPFWTTVVGILGAILTLAAIVAVQVLYYNTERKEQQRKVVDQPYEELNQLRAEQETNLYRYRWINEQEGVVGIPIEDAMQLIAQENRK